MLRDAFAIEAAAGKHRFCYSFRGLSPMEFTTFSFRDLGSIPPVRLRETGKTWGLRRPSTACYIPFRDTGAAAWRASTYSPKVPRQGSRYYTGDIHDTPPATPSP